MQRRPLPFRSLVWACALALAAASPSVLARPEPASANGSEQNLRPWVASGEWNGTWYHVNRDFKLVMWIRTSDGVQQIKLQYLSLKDAEGFETDWQGQAEYTYRGHTGKMSVNLTERDERMIAGTWDWVLDRGSFKRTETGRFQLSPGAGGRMLVMAFDELTRVISSDPDRPLSLTSKWVFRKASRRLIRWDEVPF